MVLDNKNLHTSKPTQLKIAACPSLEKTNMYGFQVWSTRESYSLLLYPVNQNIELCGKVMEGAILKMSKQMLLE